MAASVSLGEVPGGNVHDCALMGEDRRHVLLESWVGEEADGELRLQGHLAAGSEGVSGNPQPWDSDRTADY